MLFVYFQFNKKKILTFIGSTTNSDSTNDNTNVVNHSSDFDLPHSMLNKIMKNAGTTIDNATTIHAM